MFHHSKKFIWILLTLPALGLSACASVSTPPPASFTPEPTFTPAPPTPTSEPMALTGYGEGVTLVEFDAEVQRYITAQTALGKPVDEGTAASTVTEDFIAQLLLSQAARTNGFMLDDAALQARIDSLAAQIGGVEALSGPFEAHTISTK